MLPSDRQHKFADFMSVIKRICRFYSIHWLTGSAINKLQSILLFSLPSLPLHHTEIQNIFRPPLKGKESIIACMQLSSQIQDPVPFLLCLVEWVCLKAECWVRSCPLDQMGKCSWKGNICPPSLLINSNSMNRNPRTRRTHLTRLKVYHHHHHH